MSKKFLTSISVPPGASGTEVPQKGEIDTLLAAKENTASKDGSDGYVGLTLFAINFKNVADTFISFFTNANTTSRTYTFPDKDGTVAMTSDIPFTMTATEGGLAPPPPNNTTDFLRGDGTFATIPNPSTMTATVGGLVPTPPNNTTSYLRGDGTFATLANPSTMTATVGGLVPTPPNNTTDFLRGDGTFAPAGTGTVTSVSGAGTVSGLTLTGTVTGAGSLTLGGALTLGTAMTPQFSSLGVGTAASGVAGEIRATNNITAFYTSDSRLKTNIKVIPDAINKVKLLRGVTYDWTQEYIDLHGGEDGFFIRRHDVGMIAQDVEAIFPELVVDREDGFKGMKYDRLVGLLVEAVKELTARVEELEAK